MMKPHFSSSLLEDDYTAIATDEQAKSSQSTGAGVFLSCDVVHFREQHYLRKKRCVVFTFGQI